MMDPRPGVAIYTSRYLTPSMTFIHRQMQGLAGSFDQVVLTERVENLDRFPWTPVHPRGRGIPERVLVRIYSRLTGRYTALPPSQRRFWLGVVRERNVKLIHAHFGTGGIRMLPLARAAGIPLVVTFHGFDASSLLRNASYVRSLQPVFRYARVIAVSGAVRQRLIEVGAPPENVHVHYIGVPLDDFAFVERHPPVERVGAGEPLRFLQVSNFVEKKGHAYTIAAFAELLKRYPNATLTLAGDGPLRPEMEALAAELGIRDSVRFPGLVAKPQVVSLMGESDVFVHHSVTAASGDQEGVPTVIMEAMATGLPVVSSWHSGIPELVEDGVSGYLVEERNTARLAAALERAAEADRGVGRAGAARVRERFDMSRQNERLGDHYREALGVAPEPAG